MALDEDTSNDYIDIPTNEEDSQLISSLGKTFDNCVEIAIRKNADYTGTSNDEYSNFRDEEFQTFLNQFFDSSKFPLKYDAVELGIRTRLKDKFARLTNLLLGTDPQVKGESIDDTLDDVINYAAILKAYREWKRETLKKSGL